MRTILARSITTQRRGALSAKEEKVSCGRRGAGTGRQRVLVAQSVEETTRPPDVKVRHQRPHNDGLLKPCDMDVSSAKEEMVRSGARRSAGRGRRRILVSSSFDDTRVVPSTSKLTTSDPTRTGDMGHVKHVSPVRRKSLEAVRGAVQVQDGDSYWSHGRLGHKEANRYQSWP